MAEGGWNVETLKEYFDQRFTASDKRLDEFKNEYSNHHDDLVKELNAMRQILSSMSGGESEGQRLTTTVVSIVALVASLATVVAVFVVH